jgi:hypothetical protein
LLESPRPEEFGTAGQNWENIGWRVAVGFTELANRIRPKDHIEILRPLLPDRYSPLQVNGNGIQSIYLTELPATLAQTLIGLIGDEVAPIAVAARDVKPVSADDLDFWERKLEQLWRRLQPLEITEMPLEVPPPRGSRFGSPLMLSRVHWVRPELVAEVKFLTWTEDNLLRQVVYQGLREDKPAAEVRRPVPKADAIETPGAS